MKPQFAYLALALTLATQIPSASTANILSKNGSLPVGTVLRLGDMFYSANTHSFFQISDGQGSPMFNIYYLDYMIAYSDLRNISSVTAAADGRFSYTDTGNNTYYLGSPRTDCYGQYYLALSNVGILSVNSTCGFSWQSSVVGDYWPYSKCPNHFTSFAFRQNTVLISKTLYSPNHGVHH